MPTRTYQKVVLKPDHRSQEEFHVVVNGPQYDAWSKGDKTIPLADVVDSFEVFVTLQGSQGVMGRASKMQLENVFGTSKDVDVVLQILERGSLTTASAFLARLGPCLSLAMKRRASATDTSSFCDRLPQLPKAATQAPTIVSPVYTPCPAAPQLDMAAGNTPAARAMKLACFLCLSVHVRWMAKALCFLAEADTERAQSEVSSDRRLRPSLFCSHLNVILLFCDLTWCPSCL